SLSDVHSYYLHLRPRPTRRSSDLGEGGQNLIGGELGAALGVVRTEELLAARAIDGGQQFFTRAYDFGFSKSAEETFRFWPRDSRSEEHTSELQSRENLVCRLLLEK